MDLAGMINDGAEALHRGSVDREELAADAKPTETPQSRRRPPVWAQVYRGRANRVRDQRRATLAETRPELAEIFSHDTGSRPPVEAEVSVEQPEAKPSAAAPITNGQPSSAKGPGDPLSSLGPGGNVSLTGLAPSIAGMIPNDDQTKVLAGWIFEQTEKLTDDAMLDNLEVEFKIGLITDEHSGLRHRFPGLSESVIDPIYFQQHRLRFKSDMDPQRFRGLETLLDKIMSSNAGVANNQITKENILSRDAVYQVVYKPLGANKTRVRVSTDERGRVLECISKQRIGDFHIAMPNSVYDLKMSLSLEHPVDSDVLLPQIKDMQPSFERNKNRLKWTAPGCDIDLTSVHGQGANGSPQITKEGEIETNTKLLSDVLREYRSKTNPGESLDKFLEIIRYTMDSARYLSRNL